MVVDKPETVSSVWTFLRCLLRFVCLWLGGGMRRSLVLADPDGAGLCGGEELGSGGHGTRLHPQVTADYLAARFHYRSVFLEDDM